MTRLLHDRYLACDDERAWDLATGDVVRLEDVGIGTTETQPPSGALIEVLDHGRDGAPRWVMAEKGPGGSMEVAARRAAADARARGFVPMSVEVYLRLRDVLTEDLRSRALMLIARSGTAPELARRAFVDAAAHSPRPHVLLTFPSTRPARPFAVREAPAAYGAPSAATVLPRADVAQHVQRAQRAMAFVRAGCHAAGERLLREVAAALVRRRAFDPAARTLVSLGRVLLERGRALDADRTFEDAAGVARDGQLDSIGLDARVWQAVARTDAARLTAAESLCRAVLLTAELPPHQKAWADATLARVLLWQRRFEEIAPIECSAQSLEEMEEVLAASVMATAVRLFIERGQVFEAGQCSRALIDRAVSDDPTVRTIASMAQLRVLCAAGDLGLAERCFVELTQHGRAARAPLRVVRARLLWANALSRAGRGRDAEREIKRLCRIRAAAPPLLREAIDRGCDGRVRVTRNPLDRVFVGSATRATALVKVVQDEERDDAALRGVLSYAAKALNTSRIEMISADAGPPATVLAIGSGTPTRLGSRALEAGIVVGPDPGDSGHEIAVPVRIGHRLLAAFVARWAMDVTPAAYASELLELAAAIAAPRVEAMLATARETARAAVAVPELIGIGSSMNDVRKAIARAAAAPFAVLIEGESGVGKELVARAIHQLGPRRERRFCDVNCAALPEDLLESELFGHARGAFTGAVADRSGLFEEANGGTVFLDEVADLSSRAQAKLLRALQQHEVRRVGEAFSRKIDVRVVSAANRDVRAEAAEGRFRQDLLYRLDVIRIRIPPLRERPEDIPVLAAYFWRSAAARVGTTATLTHGVVAALSRYYWPGNVRELQNVVAALAVAAPSRGRVRPSLLPSVVTGATLPSCARLTDARAQFERRFIEVALARAGGSPTRAARELGMSRQGLLKMMIRLGLGGGASIGTGG